MNVQRQNSDGSWSPAEPIPMLGWKGRVEVWAIRRKWYRLARFMGAWDERGL